MAITFVNAGTVGSTSGTGGNPSAPGIPASIATGDLMILVALAGDNVTITLPGGWTKFIEQNDGTAQRLTVAWKAYAGDSAPTVTHTGGDSCVARIWAFRGTDTVNPIETSSVNNSTPGTTVTATTITPNSGNSAVVGIWTEECTGNTSGAPTWASYSGTNPTFTEVGSDTNTIGSGLNEVGFGFAWGLSTTGGATGSRTAVVTGAALNPPTTDIGALFSIAPQASAVFIPQSYMAPLTGLQIPGQPAVGPMLNTGVEQNAIGYVSPLPITQFVNPLSLVMGPRIFPVPQPYWLPVVGGDITITQDTGPGLLVLTAGTHVVEIDVAVTATAGILVLTAGTHTFTEQMAPTVGILNLGAGTHAPQEALVQSTPGILNLGAGAHTLAEQLQPGVGILFLGAGAHIIPGGASASIPDTPGHTIHITAIH